jgi:alpha-L-rhamnosidase
MKTDIRLLRKYGLLLAVSALSVSTNGYAQPKWPAVTSETRPWTRWWWLGSAVDPQGITQNLEAYRSVGLGGVEITPIYGIQGQEKRHIEFLTPEWMKVLGHTLGEAKRLDMGVDLANATGWPFGGPWVKDEDASRSVYLKRYRMAAGEGLTEPVMYHRETWVRTANNKLPRVSELKQPVSANPNLQALALDQIQFSGALPLETLMGYGPNGAVIDLTSFVKADGKLDWSPASGVWEVYAIFSGLHGKMVERAAPGGEGYAIDHFSQRAAKAYFRKFDTAFAGQDLSYLRGFFNDSYEVDDARGQANWTWNFFEAFKKSRGYDLHNHLPALYGMGDTTLQQRVLFDYRSVIDEMILHNFTEEWKQWGQQQGKILRNQSHGSPANTLDLYAVVDIPETEGTEPMRFRFASSAAHVTGKRLVSAEAATWLDEHFLSSLGDVKKSVDNYFLGGVNHIVYHGTAYSPKDAPWPGWLFYAAVHFQPVNPQWQDFSALNSYVTRVQSFLQQGRPDNDVLVYYPITDRYSTRGGPLLQHFDGMERNFTGSPFEKISEWMYEHGYHFDFFSERQLQQFRFADGRIRTGGNDYQTILIPSVQLMDIPTLEKLLNLSRAGATILVYGNMPTDVPGLHDLKARRTRFDGLISGLSFEEKSGMLEARQEKGRWIVASDMSALMKVAGLKAASFEASGLGSISRIIDGKPVHFVVNRSDKTFDGWVALPSAPGTSWLFFDPMTGNITVPATRNDVNGNISIRIALDPHASMIIRASSESKAKPHTYDDPEARSITLDSQWSIRFSEGGPELPGNQTIEGPRYWTSLDGSAFQSFSGRATYATRFKLIDLSVPRWTLDLGKLSATASVRINGKDLGSLVGPTFKLDIPANLLRAENELEVTVSSLMANRIADMDRKGVPWKIFYNINMSARRKENLKNGVFDAGAWSPLPSGLAGPVVLKGHGIPVKK